MITDMDGPWINSAFIITGAGLLLWSIYFYLADCLSAPYTDMGTEMSFSHYWLFAMVLVLLGALPLVSLGLSVYRAVIPVIHTGTPCNQGIDSPR